MLFNSYTFLFVFLPVVLAGAYILVRFRTSLAVAWLVFASLRLLRLVEPAPRVCCSWPRSRSTTSRARPSPGAAESRAGSALASCAARSPPTSLCSAISSTPGFFVANVNALSRRRHCASSTIVLPLGISFFTFTQIAFLVDAYRGKVARYDFAHYALFVTYFPHLIAGPILHHREMMPQFAAADATGCDCANLAVGLTIFAIGLFKKVVLADGIAPYAQPGLRAAAAADAPDASSRPGAARWPTRFQLYFDFSGYSDMAIGLSLMFGIRLPLNFDSPYKATNIIEFWRRWHMTLSRFLRDYLYIPLGGNRRGALRRYVNLVVTMLLGGLWHGAGWTFVVWGARTAPFCHQSRLARAARRDSRRARPGSLARQRSAPAHVRRGLRTWVFFRADDLPSAVLILRGLAGLNGHALPAPGSSRLARPRVPSGRINCSRDPSASGSSLTSGPSTPVSREASVGPAALACSSAKRKCCGSRRCWRLRGSCPILGRSWHARKPL